MALTKTIEEDKIEIVSEFRHIHVRTATIIKDDGEEMSRKFHRHLLYCGRIHPDTGVWENTDVSGESAEVQAVANAVWTDTVRNKLKTALENEPKAPTS